MGLRLSSTRSRRPTKVLEFRAAGLGLNVWGSQLQEAFMHVMR